MRVFDSKIKNYSYFLYRLIAPIFDPVKLYEGVIGYPWYFHDFVSYKQKDPNAQLLNINLFPILNEKTSHPFDSHYYYQEIWAFNHILKSKPKMHVDVASKIQFSGFIASLTKCDYVDIRAVKINLRNLRIVEGSLLNMPYKNNSVESLSSLHVIEHIGLGRYGDPIDPDGTEKACRELIRILKPGGKLYISLPTGKYRICFNAHRVYPPNMILHFFSGLKLLDFSYIDDEGNFHQHEDSKNAKNLNYGCGMYIFTKK